MSQTTEELIPVNRLPGLLPTHPVSQTVYRWIYRGLGEKKLSVQKVGGRLFTTKSDIREFLGIEIG